MVTSLAYVVGGLLLLLVSGDILVRGSVSLAKRLRIPALFIGLTIVAFGTSAPELVVGVQSALNGPEAIGIAVGNVVGSNIANVLLVLGVPALFYPILTDQPMIRRNALMMVTATVLFVYFCIDGQITMIEGFSLFGLIVAYLFYSALRASRASAEDFTPEEVEEVEQMTGLPKSGFMIGCFILTACIGLPVGAYFCVNGAEDLALRMGVAPSIIGVTVIALGTSLPELATSVLAAIHRHSAMAIGNVIGSNIFNILAVMGVTSMVATPLTGAAIPVEDSFLNFDLWVMLGTALVILAFAFAKGRVGRFYGIVFLLAYIAFITIVFQSGGALMGHLTL